MEAIDLYQLNAVDPDVPLEESLGALVELREAGKIRHIGLCNVNTEELARAQARTRIASVQDRYDLLTRANDPVIDACTRAGIAFLPWAPPMNELRAGPGSALARIADAHKVNPSQVALAWLFTRSPVVTPLPGTVIPGWFEEDLAALEIMLSAEEAELLLTGA